MDLSIEEIKDILVNPYYAINPAIRSRCQLLEVKQLTNDDIAKAIQRALTHPQGLQGYTIDEDATNLIARHSNGDVRYALNILEICALASNGSITKDTVSQY